MIRSATQVTAEVLAAGTDLVVVGRAGIGLDNVDVAEATKRGVMVVNAPTSNILSAAEHTMALLLAQARNVPQANADLRAGRWNRSKWEGVELHGKTLGIVGLGRVGVLVAQRAHAFGMRLVAYDPFVSPDRARQLGVQVAESMNELVATSDFVTIHATKTPDTIGLVNADVLAHAKPGMRLVNAGRGGIVDEDALADAVRDGRLGGAAIDTFAKEPTTESPLFELDNVVVTPHLGASTVEAQDKAGETIAEQVVLALRGDFVPFAVNVAASEASEVVRPFLPLAERLGRLFSGSGRRLARRRSRCSTRVRSPTTTAGCSRCRSSKACSARSLPSRSRSSNAPQLAEARGIAVRVTTQADARNYVNLIEVRGTVGEARSARGRHAVRQATASRASSGSTSTPSTCRPARNMLVVHNSDTPGMIGRVTSVLGDAKVNISDMGVGRSPSGEAALMVLATDSPVSSETVAPGRRPSPACSQPAPSTSASK